MLKLIKMKCVGYVRVSSEEQVSNFSLATQERYIREEAKKRGLQLVKIFKEEGKSAKTLDRPQLIECLDYCHKERKNIASLFVYRIDRLSRETADYLAVRKKLTSDGVELVSCTEATGTNPTEKFIETVLASIATLDNEIRGQRARDGIKARFLSGVPTNKPPVGYRLVTGQRKVVKDEYFESMKDVWQEMATGKYSLSAIAEYMNKNKIRTTRGNNEYKLTKKSAGRLFKCKFYHGILESSKYGEAKGKHMPMITEETYWRVQDIIRGRTQNFSTRRMVANPNFPLRRLVKCSVCGKGFTGSFVRGRNKRYAKYYCPMCISPSVPAKRLDKQVIKLLRQLTPTKEFIDNFNALLGYEVNSRYNDFQNITVNAKAKIKEKKQMLVMLTEGHMQGKYSDEIYQDMKSKYENELIGLNVQANESNLAKYDIENIIKFCEVFMSDLAKPYITGDVNQKIAYLGSIYPEGLTFKDNLLEPVKIASMFALLSGKKTLGEADGTRTHDLPRDRRTL